MQDGYICQGCTDQARGNLLALSGDPGQPADRPRDPGLLADLELLMSRQDVADPDTARPAELPDVDDVPRDDDEPIAAHPMPVHLGAGKILGQAHADLRRWVRALVEQRHGAELQRDIATIALERTRRVEAFRQPSRIPGVHLNGYMADRPRRPRLVQLPDARQPRELALWLGRHLHDLRQHPAAGEIIAGLSRHARRAEDVVTGRDLEYLGLCTECWHEREREVMLYAERGADLVICPRCGSGYDCGELRTWLLDRARDQLVDAPTLSRALVDHVRDVRRERGLTAEDLPWSVDVIKGLGARGRLQRHEPTRAERDTGTVTQVRYRVGEVMDLVETIAEERAAKRDKRRARAS